MVLQNLFKYGPVKGMNLIFSFFIECMAQKLSMFFYFIKFRIAEPMTLKVALPNMVINIYCYD